MGLRGVGLTQVTLSGLRGQGLPRTTREGLREGGSAQDAHSRLSRASVPAQEHSSHPGPSPLRDSRGGPVRPVFYRKLQRLVRQQQALPFVRILLHTSCWCHLQKNLKTAKDQDRQNPGL